MLFNLTRDLCVSIIIIILSGKLNRQPERTAGQADSGAAGVIVRGDENAAQRFSY